MSPVPGCAGEGDFDETVVSLEYAARGVICNKVGRPVILCLAVCRHLSN